MATTELDARTIDEPPFDRILQALSDLESDDRLVLVNDFEPEPLYSVLESRGFEYETERVAHDEWRVKISPAG